MRQCTYGGVGSPAREGGLTRFYVVKNPEFKCGLQGNRLNYSLYFARHYDKKINIRKAYPIRDPLRACLLSPS